MATRSTITVKCADGKYRGIYCHFDGYPQHNGRILLDHYNTQEDAEKVVSLGDLSALAASVACPAGHTFDSPLHGYCIAYGRDRGEVGVETTVGDAFPVRDSEEYDYLWDGEKWNVSDYHRSMQVLTEEMCG